MKRGQALSIFSTGLFGVLIIRPILSGAVPDGLSLIPAGTFTMGSPETELGHLGDETQHTVTLTRAFYMQQTELTKAQWDAVRAEGTARGYTDLPDGRNGDSGDASGRHPVTDVSWYDVVKWLNLKSELEGLTPCYSISGLTYKTGQSTPICDFNANGYRLPTESEWEYSCRAGTDTAFYSGPITYIGESPLDPNLDLIGWYSGNSGYNTHPVGEKQANAWGLFDMPGNVWEWCWDWYGAYPEATTDPDGSASGMYRVLRGGVFTDDAQYCRSAFRFGEQPDLRYYGIGFRITRSVSSKMWGPYQVSSSYCDTTPWLGWLWVENDPWIWSVDLSKWLYCPGETVGERGAWVYVPN